jgi:hypothetical protein
MCYVGVFFMLFIWPNILQPPDRMQFPVYLPAETPPGSDLKIYLTTSRAWAVDHQNPYATNWYPPLFVIVYTPLAFLDQPTAHLVVTLLILVIYSLAMYAALGLYRKVHKNSDSSLFMLVFLLGLIAYGLQFEIERGQSNLIAFGLCFLSIYLFHAHPRFRLPAYLLFSLAVQLKLFPILFMVLLVDDWKAWRQNLSRFVGLGALNFALLFVLGVPAFVDFINALVKPALHPYVWETNHSLVSFVALGFLNPAEKINFFLLVVLCYIGCGLAVFIQTVRFHKGFNPYLLMLIALGALILPPTNHDYTLSYLPIPVVIFLAFAETAFESKKMGRAYLVYLFSLFTFCLLFCVTLFSYATKPPTFALQSNFLPLLGMLITCTAIALLALRPARP